MYGVEQFDSSRVPNIRVLHGSLLRKEGWTETVPALLKALYIGVCISAMQVGAASLFIPFVLLLYGHFPK